MKDKETIVETVETVETVTIMMATYNRLELTKQTLDSLFKNTKFPFHLVIIDNASSDDTVNYIKSVKYPEVCLDITLVENEENKGIAIARNQALKIASDINSDWLCTIDNDVLFSEGWLTECVEILRENKKFGMIGINFEGTKYPIMNLGNKEIQYKAQGNLGTACTVFNKKLHKSLGYFNTEYGKYGEEDADFGMRVRVLGYKMGYIKEMGIHLGQGENDQGEYREWKTECHKRNLAKFHKNCSDYANGRKSLYIPFSGN